METNSDKSYEESPVSIGSLQLSAPIGIGTWAWGDRRIWDYDSSQDDALYQGFAKIVDSGVNFFDTAEIYGNGQSEILLSQFRKKYQESHPNSSILIATKFLPVPWRITHNSFNQALSNSLNRLDMSCVDLYQSLIHGAAFSVRSIETWAEALADAKERGQIKEIGVSNYSASQVIRTQKVLEKRGFKLASNQVEFSLLRNNALTNGVLDTCKELGIQLIAYSPLAMGRLTGKYSAENPPPDKRKFGRYSTLEEINSIVDVLKEIGRKYEKSPAQVALNWVICKGAIPIVGVRNEKQADENLCCFGWRLTEEEVKRLDNVSRSGPTWTIWQE